MADVVSFSSAPDAIELRHLRAFVAVAEELNFGRAAARLFLSQPALSRQIRALERLVGCALLRRSTHRVDLTLAGEALLTRARELLAGVDDAVRAARSVGGELERQVMEIWQPIADIAGGEDADLQTLRDAMEQFQGQLPVPDVDVRPVNAGGVPSLVVGKSGTGGVRLLYVHGGAYVLGSAFGCRHMAGALALAAGADVLVPEYRLAPEHPFPAAVEDCVRAYLWMLDRGAAAPGVVLAGESTGAGLVLSVLVTLKRQGLPMPGGAALLCPAFMLSAEDQAALPAEPVPSLTAGRIRAFAAAYLDGYTGQDDVVNPLGADLSGLPPLLIQAATGDVVLHCAQRLAERARQQGVDARLELYAAPNHLFQLFWSFLPEAADAVEQVGRFAQGVRGEHAAPASAG